MTNSQPRPRQAEQLCCILTIAAFLLASKRDKLNVYSELSRGCRQVRDKVNGYIRQILQIVGRQSVGDNFHLPLDACDNKLTL